MEFRFDVHPTEDTIEEYCFRRLSADAKQALEEHLLLCESCQQAFDRTEEYIRLMKAVAAKSGAVRSKPWLVVGERAYVLSAATLAVVFTLLLPRVHTTISAPAARVTLATLRGGTAGSTIVSAPAMRPLDLAVDVTNLSIPSKGVRLEMVDAGGHRVWSGTPPVSGNSTGPIVAHVDAGLKSGIYWVRLSSAEGELLREFGLQIN